MVQTAASTYATCKLEEGNDCSLSSFGNKPTLVYPGGETRCFNGDEYAFAVVPGDTDKLLFYFEGGGACWELDGHVVESCTKDLLGAVQDSGYGLGVQDMADPRNPFRNYTVVEPLYCS